VLKSEPGAGKFVPRENYGFAYEKIPALDAQRRIRETPVDRSGKKPSQATLEEQVKKLSTELDISNDKVQQLTNQLKQGG